MKKNTKSESWYIKAICLFFSVCLLATCPIAATFFNMWKQLLRGWAFILLSPCPLVTDYFQLGNLASAFLNAGVCGLACTLIMILIDAECDVNTLAGYFLVIAHCFYGLNFLNMWPPMLGILLFCKVYKVNFKDNLGMAMFSTAFGPFISELLFRYHLLDEEYLIYTLQVDIIGVFYVILFCIVLGFAIPAMLPGAMRLHKGFNLYNGGLAFGLLGLLLYAFMYKTFGIEAPVPYEVDNPVYEYHGRSHMEFICAVLLTIFVLLIVWGWFLNGRSLRGYGKLLESSGYNADFLEEFGLPVVLINIGICGCMMVGYFSAVIMLTDGAGFTGATTGVILAALAFTAKGQHPRNVWPVLLGFVLLSVFVTSVSTIAGREVPWTLSTQGYMNGAAFATGLCPIAGHYGKRYGVLAGFVCAVICTSTIVMHGGFMLYNGGLATGITALILIPCLEYYWHEKKE